MIAQKLSFYFVDEEESRRGKSFMINFLKQIAFNCWQVTSFYRPQNIQQEGIISS